MTEPIIKIAALEKGYLTKWGENVAAGLCEGAPLVALCVNVPEPLALTAPAEGVAPLPPLANVKWMAISQLLRI